MANGSAGRRPHERTLAAASAPDIKVVAVGRVLPCPHMSLSCLRFDVAVVPNFVRLL